MAGVTKRPNSKYWWAIFYDGAGQKMRKSTKLTKRKEAQDLANEWEKLAKAGREKRLTEDQCRRVVAEIAQKYGGQKIQFHSTREWFTEWLAGRKASTAPRTYERYSSVSEDFLTYLGGKADLTINAVTITDIRNFRDDQAKKRTRSTETLNQIVSKVLTIPFSMALKLGYVDVNPCAGVPPLPVEKVEREPFTLEQVSKILAAADGEWVGMVLVGFYTALRLMDVARLKVENIQGDLLRVTTKKTGKLVQIPIHPALSQWLAKWLMVVRTAFSQSRFVLISYPV